MKQKKKRSMGFLCIFILGGCLCTGCGTGSTSPAVDTEQRLVSEQLADGEYQAEVTLKGGSGRAGIESPATVTVTDGKAYAVIVWSSANYDYMIVEDERYLNESTQGNSTFTIPITGFDCDVPVTANTTAMSTPHEIDYYLHFELEE